MTNQESTASRRVRLLGEVAQSTIRLTRARTAPVKNQAEIETAEYRAIVARSRALAGGVTVTQVHDVRQYAARRASGR